MLADREWLPAATDGLPCGNGVEPRGATMTALVEVMVFREVVSSVRIAYISGRQTDRASAQGQVSMHRDDAATPARAGMKADEGMVGRVRRVPRGSGTE